MKTKEQQAKEYAEKLPHYQDRKQHAVSDSLFETAEQAFEAGLQEALKLIKKTKITGSAVLDSGQKLK